MRDVFRLHNIQKLMAQNFGRCIDAIQKQSLTKTVFLLTGGSLYSGTQAFARNLN
jgi:hypothetical protein